MYHCILVCVLGGIVAGGVKHGVLGGIVGGVLGVVVGYLAYFLMLSVLFIPYGLTRLLQLLAVLRSDLNAVAIRRREYR